MEERCDCEEHNCVGAQSTVGHEAVAATTVMTLVILQIVVVPPTPTPSESDTYHRHWLLSLVHCNVRIRTKQPGTPGVGEQPGHNRRNHKQNHTRSGHCEVTEDFRADTGGVVESSSI